jgi:hypothetical protein
MNNIEKIKKFVKGEEFKIQPDNSGYGSKNCYGIDTKSYRYAVFQITAEEVNIFHAVTEFTTGYWMKFKE